MSIIDLIESQLDDRFVRAATNETGLSAEETKTTTRAAVPALLASLLGSISKPAGAKALGPMLTDQSQLGGLSSMPSGAGTQSMVSTGIGALTSLLGEGKLSSLANAVGNFAGISQKQGRSVIGMLFPLVMGVLGREQRGAPSVDGIARLLKSQKQEIADAMPASVASSLRSSGMLDALDEEPMARRPAASAATTTASTSRYAVGTQRLAQKNRSWFWPIAAGLAALALVVWGLTQFTDDEPDRQIAVDTSTDAPADTTQLAAAAPSDVDLRRELTGVVDRAEQSLRGVTDAASAEAALPTLSELNEDLDGMVPMFDRLPDSARTAFADFARTGYSRLETEIDRIESIPAIPDDFKQVVRELGGKVESFFTRGRG